MLAVIKTGGKQYKVAPGDKIRIEKVEKKEGEDIAFEEVLLVEKNNKVQVGTPLVKGAKVSGKIIKQGKKDKIIVFKFKPKIRYKKKAGHRQPYSEIEITKIEA